MRIDQVPQKYVKAMGGSVTQLPNRVGFAEGDLSHRISLKSWFQARPTSYA
jgi:hypothetical protein